MFENELITARQAAHAAGAKLNRRLGKTHRIQKKGDIDLVTEADLEAEETILDILRKRFPHDRMVTEEAGDDHRHAERVWIIDPLDGTTNFAHAYPVFAVSIALEVKGELVAGVIYNPNLVETFHAVKGRGAYLNDRSISVSQTGEILEALLATGFPYNVHEIPEGILDRLKKMLTAAQGVRRGGSAALDLAYVAAGRLDGYWEEGLKPWDTAAGALIVKEAGGRLTDYRGDLYTPYLKTIVASNGPLHETLLSLLKDAL